MDFEFVNPVCGILNEVINVQRNLIDFVVRIQSLQVIALVVFESMFAMRLQNLLLFGVLRVNSTYEKESVLDTFIKGLIRVKFDGDI